MFKLVVLSVLLAVAAARPGLLSPHAPLLLAAPVSVVHEPAYAKVGAIVKSIPTAVSHQSSSVVHSSAHLVQPIVAPVVKTVYTAPVLHSGPALLSHSGPALFSHSGPALLSHSAGWEPSW